MTRRLIFAGLLVMPGCAMDGALTLTPACGPCRMAPPAVIRGCNGPVPVPMPRPAPCPQVPTPLPLPVPVDDPNGLTPIVDAVPPAPDDAPPPTPVIPDSTPAPAPKPTSWRPVATTPGE